MGKRRPTRRQSIVDLSNDEPTGPLHPATLPAQQPRVFTSTNSNKDSYYKPDISDIRHVPVSRKPPGPSSTTSPSKQHQTKPSLKTKPIYSFFNNISDSQGSQVPVPSQDLNSTVEDTIQDDSEDALIPQFTSIDNKLSSSLALRKRHRDTLGSEPGLSDQTFTGSQKFLKTSSGSRKPTSDIIRVPSSDIGPRPWAEKYGPINSGELAVHKRKFDEVRSWLTGALSGETGKKLLIVKGPAGCGKTTAMSLLSRDLNFNIIEWRNPNPLDHSAESLSIPTQFDDFVRRAHDFGALELKSPQPPPQTAQSIIRRQDSRVILIEEFPSTISTSSPSLQAFRTTIRKLLATNTQSPGELSFQGNISNAGFTPVVIIVSETPLTSNSPSADTLTAHRLLGVEILNHPTVNVIEFNRIASTIMSKALELIVVKEARESGRRKTPGPEVIKQLSEIGDIRNAVFCLEFLCLRGDDGDGWGSKVAFTKPKRGVRPIALTKMEHDSLQTITQRESALGIFHSVGKIVYNKRDDTVDDDYVPQPPFFFPNFRRDKPPLVDANRLIEELGTDTQVFIAALHENYVLSCRGSTSSETIDITNGCIDALSDADLLSPNSLRYDSSTKWVPSASGLRQDEISFQVSTRGILFHLPHPVQRISPMVTKTGRHSRPGDRSHAYRMFYPISLRLWRLQEEFDATVDLVIARLRRGYHHGLDSNLRNMNTSRGGIVETWTNTFPQVQLDSNHHTSSTKLKDPLYVPPILLTGGKSARKEMIMERLPYLRLIISHGSSNFLDRIDALERVTKYTGTNTIHDENAEDEVEETGPSNDLTNVLYGTRPSTAIGDLIDDTVEKDVEKLMLSDDEIED